MTKVFSISNWQLAIGSCTAFLTTTAVLAGAATNDLTGREEIPPLRPPKPEIPPTFWEQHGLLIVVLSLTFVVAIGVLLKLLFQRRPPVIPTAAETARAGLVALQGQPADLDWHDSVSAILRNYFVAALGLPAQEPTNRELCSAIDAAGAQACEKARLLLLALDAHRFDPESNPPVQNATGNALEVIELTEAHLHPPRAEASPATSSST